MATSLPNTDVREAAEITLSDVYTNHVLGDKVEVQYEYDHGDSWDHRITFLGRADPLLRRSLGIPASLEAVCLAGEVRVTS